MAASTCRTHSSLRKRIVYTLFANDTFVEVLSCFTSAPWKVQAHRPDMYYRMPPDT